MHINNYFFFISLFLIVAFLFVILFVFLFVNWVNQSVGHCYLLLSSTFRVNRGFLFGKMIRFSRQSRCPTNSGSVHRRRIAGQPIHVPESETDRNLMVPDQVNAADAVKPPTNRHDTCVTKLSYTKVLSFAMKAITFVKMSSVRGFLDGKQHFQVQMAEEVISKIL